ncbi:MAG: WbqC family protein [Bacteroidia bacterium]
MPDSVVLPLCYFPPVSWLAAVLQYPDVVVEVHQPYQKQRYTSRAHIRVANQVMALSVPVDRRSRRAPIIEKKPVYQQDWRGNHLRSIVFAYRSSPWFEYYEDHIKEFFEMEFDNLVKLDLASTGFLMQALGIETELKLTEAFLPADYYGTDLRADFDPGRKNWPSWFGEKSYPQVFEGFEKDLSGLDLLFNLGPEARGYLGTMVF